MQPHVLVADDDPVVRRLAEAALQAACRVTTACDGAEALDLARRLQPDVIVSDLVMPQLDGLSLKRALAADEALAWTPFIFLTSRGDEATKRLGLLSGADDFLTKPIDARALRRRVQLLLERTRGAREASVARFTREIDAAFVPESPPRVPGYDIAVAVEPARTGGGDVVDVLRLDDGTLLLLHADVMGKGPRAKFFAYAFIGYLRGLFHASPPSLQSSPAGMWDRLNTLYGRDSMLQEVFVTGFLLHLDPRAHRLRAACAGAIPGYLVDPGAGVLERLEAGGGVPGVFPDAYGEAEHVLQPGHSLVLVSDGITEARDPGGAPWGEDALGGVLHSRRACSAQEIAGAVLAATREFMQGTMPYDDRSVVVVRRSDIGASPKRRSEA